VKQDEINKIMELLAGIKGIDKVRAITPDMSEEEVEKTITDLKGVSVDN